MDHRFSYGRMLFGAGFLDEANDAFDTLIRDYPHRWDFRICRILANMQRGDTANAQRDVSWLEDLEAWNEPGGSMIWARAIVAGALGDLEGAVNLFRELGWNLSRFHWPQIFYAPLRGYEPFEELVAPKG